MAGKLRVYAGRADLLVLALPRGGVPVAFEIARALRAPLDVLVVRKLGVPGHEELAMGAIAAGVRVLNADAIERLRITDDIIETVTLREQHELERREKLLRGASAPVPLQGRTVVLVDDGLATGASMRVAVAAVRAYGPANIVVAVPVAPPQTCQLLLRDADEVICACTPAKLDSIGRWYAAFPQLGDAEVHDLLARARDPA